MCFDKKLIDRNIGPTPIKVELTVYILTTLTYFLFLIFFASFFLRRESVIRNNSSIGGSSSSHFYPRNLNSLGHCICVHQENISVAEGFKPGTPGL